MQQSPFSLLNIWSPSFNFPEAKPTQFWNRARHRINSITLCWKCTNCDFRNFFCENMANNCCAVNRVLKKWMHETWPSLWVKIKSHWLGLSLSTSCCEEVKSWICLSYGQNSHVNGDKFQVRLWLLVIEPQPFQYVPRQGRYCWAGDLTCSQSCGWKWAVNVVCWFLNTEC